MPELITPGSNGLFYAGDPATQRIQNPSLGRLAEYHRAAAGDSREAVNMYRAASPLPADAQKMLDKSLIRVGRKKLVIVDDLLTAGLTFDLSNWLAVPTLEWNRINDGGNARRSMVPKARGQRFVLDQTPATLPIYCTWGDFSFDIRTLLAAERAGYSIDTAHAEAATRKVNEHFEDQAIHGAGLQIYGGHVAPGFFTPGFAVNATTYVGNEAWDNVGHTGEEIRQDVMGMIAALQADNFTGPYRLYVPLSYWQKLQDDYKSATSGTTMERLTDGMGDMLSIRMSEHLPANRTLMIQLTSDVVDVVVGQQPTLLSWEDGPGFERYFMVLGCMIVRIKSNYLGNQGFVIGNTN